MTSNELLAKLFSPSKNRTIEMGKNLLRENGFDYQDYIVSLEGPTLIFTEEGRKKLTTKIRQEIKGLGIKIL